MNHDDVRHRLSDYIDGALSDSETREVEEHLGSCPRCSDALGELRRTIEHIKSVEEVEPPAWMTGKIMARVRAEEERKKGLFRRLFFPLHVKLPLEALGVLFLAVTAFFINQDMQRQTQIPEAQVQVFADKEKTAPRNKADQAGSRAREPKQVPQKPGYQALDMKRQYEPAPPPVPLERKQAASQPSPSPQPDLQMQKEGAPADRASAQAPGAAAAKPWRGLGYSDQTSRGAGNQPRAMVEQAPRSRPESGVRAGMTLIVRDVPASAEQAANAVRQLGGTVVKREAAGDGMTLTISLDSAKEQQVRERLKRIGELKSGDVAGKEQDGKVILEIRVLQGQP